MPGVAAGLTLLLVNLGLIGAVLAFSPTPRGRRQATPADRCFVCATPDPETTVSGYPVCTGCEGDYFDAVS